MSLTFIEFNRCVLVDTRRGKIFEYLSPTVDELSASQSSYFLKDFIATAHDAGGRLVVHATRSQPDDWNWRRWRGSRGQPPSKTRF